MRTHPEQCAACSYHEGSRHGYNCDNWREPAPFSRTSAARRSSVDLSAGPSCIDELGRRQAGEAKDASRAARTERLRAERYRAFALRCGARGAAAVLGLADGPPGCRPQSAGAIGIADSIAQQSRAPPVQRRMSVRMASASAVCISGPKSRTSVPRFARLTSMISCGRPCGACLRHDQDAGRRSTPRSGA